MNIQFSSALNPNPGADSPAVAVTLRDAVAAGELPVHTDVEVAVDALVSPPYYRLMLGMAPLDDAGVAALVNTVWCGCRGAREAGS